MTLTAALLLGGCTESRTVVGTELDAASFDDFDFGSYIIDAGPPDGGWPRSYDGSIDGWRLGESFPIPVIDPDETSLPLCDDPAIEMVGLPGRPCAGMDYLCTRGLRDPAGCCRQESRFFGTGCGDGMACNSNGNCLPTSTVAREATGVVGEQSWLDVIGEGDDSLFHLEPRGFQVRPDWASLADVVPDDGTTVNLGDVHFAHGRDNGLEAVAIAAPSTARRRAVYLLTAPPNVDVCVVRGDFDTMGSVSADCDSPGATRVRCPDGDADTVCLVLRSGGVRITGDNLAMVFEMGTFGTQPPGTDVRHALTVDSLDHRWIAAPRRAGVAAFSHVPGFGCRPPCRLGQTQIRHQPGCAGASIQTRSCGASGCWSAWQYAAEVCDGKDNDCDGLIDEGGAPALCGDSVDCTVDACQALHSSQQPFCRHFASALTCVSDGDLNAQTCILPRCNVDGVAYGPSLSWPTGGINTSTSVDSRGCSFLMRSDYCTNVWDSCDCNAQEFCQPMDNMQDESGCFNSPRMIGSSAPLSPNPWVGNYPCEKDKQYCTFAACCEPDVDCRDLRLAIPDPAGREQALLACSLLPSDTVLSPTGKVVECPTGDETPAICGQTDGNPCTTQTCTEPAADGSQGWGPTCPASPIYIGSAAPGCNAVVNEGCGQRECGAGASAGTCVTVPSGTAVTPCSQASGVFLGFPSCIASECNDEICVRTISETLCTTDTLDCTALPHCLGTYEVGGFLRPDGAYSSGGILGCSEPVLAPPPPEPSCPGPVLCAEDAPGVSYSEIPGSPDWWQQCFI